jgi:hypothetical protein
MRLPEAVEAHPAAANVHRQTDAIALKLRIAE